MSAIDVGRLTEDRARAILEDIRWPDGPVCPHCGEKNATRLKSRSLKTRDGVLQCNTAESFFALLKRGVTGTFHHISKRHLARYCDEFSFRWDHRRTTDGQRTVAAIQGMFGKRLLYSSMSA